MTLDEEDKRQSSNESNLETGIESDELDNAELNVENSNSDIVEPTQQPQSLSSPSQDPENSQERIRRFFNAVDRGENIEQLQIPPELLTEDQDLLEDEFDKLGDNLDVIENYMNQLDANATALQDRLRLLLASIQTNGPYLDKMDL